MGLFKKTLPRVEVELRYVESIETGIRYYGLYENGNPRKFWREEDLAPAGKDIIMEMADAFDAGYDIRWQFPVLRKIKERKHGEREKIWAPLKIHMYNEPGSKHRYRRIMEPHYEAPQIYGYDDILQGRN